MALHRKNGARGRRWPRRSLVAAAALVVVSSHASANHGAAGDPNLSVSPPALVGAARAGGCNTVEVRVRNTSTQVEVRGPWTVRLEVLDSEGEKLSERIEERLGLGHRWDKEGLSDKAAVRFESVELPAPGDYRLRARAALVSSAQKEYAAHDNTAEREVAVAADCASAAGGEQ